MDKSKDPNIVDIIPDLNITPNSLIDPNIVTNDEYTGVEFTDLEQGNIEEYETNLIPTGGFESLRRSRAVNQSTGQQIANQSAKLFGGVGLKLIENAGALLELPSLLQGDKDFSNSIIEWSKEKREALDDIFPVFRENPNEVFDWSDPAFYIKHTGELAESMGAFALTGMGVGGAVSSLTSRLPSIAARLKGSADIIRLADKVGKLTATGVTASSLAYVEGAMVGNQVFKDAIAAGKTPEEAGAIAANSVRLNTLINTPLQLTGSLAFLKSNKAINQWLKTGISGSGKSGQQVREALETYVRNNQEKLNPSWDLFREALQESTEEVVNLAAEKRGEELIKDGVGAKGSWIDEVGRAISQIPKLIQTEEGILSAGLGALGGIGQTAITKYAPTISMKGGKFNIEKSVEQQRVDAANARLDQYKDNILADLDKFDLTVEELNTAVSKGNLEAAELAKQRLFDISRFNSVIRGAGDALVGTYEEISKLDNTTDLGVAEEEKVEQLRKQREEIVNKEGVTEQELAEIDKQIEQQQEVAKKLSGKTQAMVYGVTESKDDNSYKQKAMSAIEAIKQDTKDYEDIILRYNNDELAERAGLADEILRRKITYNQQKRNKANIDQALVALKNEYGLEEKTDRTVENVNDINQYRQIVSELKAIFDSKNEYNELTPEQKTKLIRLLNMKDGRGYKKRLAKVLRTVTDKAKKADEELEKEIELYINSAPEGETRTKDTFFKEVEGKVKKYYEGNRRLPVLQYAAKEAEIGLEYANDEYVEIESEEGIKEFIKDWEKNTQERLKKQEEYRKKATKKGDDLLKTEKNRVSNNTDIAEKYLSPKQLEMYKNLSQRLKDGKIGDQIHDLSSLNDIIDSKKNKKADDEVVDDEVVEEEPTDDTEEFDDLLNQTLDEQEDEEPSDIQPEEDNSRTEKSQEKSLKESEKDKKDDEDEDDEKSYKIIEGAITLANLFKPFEGIGYRRKTSTNEVNPNYPAELVTGDISIDDEITFEVDKDYKGDDNNTYDSLLASENTTDLENMMIPIKVMWKGRKIGYVHNIKWINPDNVVENENFPNNIKKQRQILKRLRNNIVNNGGKLKGKISNIRGEYVFSKRLKGEDKNIPINDAIENKEVKLVVFTGNGVVRGGGKPIEVDHSPKFISDNSRRVGLLLPRITGKPRVALVNTNKLSEDNIETIITALKIYYNRKNSKNSDEVADKYKQLHKDIKKNYNLDLSSKDDLRTFVNKFINLTDLTSSLQADLSKKQKDKDASYLGLYDNMFYIQKLGSSAEGNGYVNKEFEKKLRERLADFHIEVNSKMLTEKVDSDNNIKGLAHKMPIIKNGKLTNQTYKTYDDYVRQHANTNIVENKVIDDNGNVHYNYFDNLIYEFEPAKISKNFPKLKKKPATKPGGRLSTEPTKTADEIKLEKVLAIADARKAAIDALPDNVSDERIDAIHKIYDKQLEDLDQQDDVIVEPVPKKTAPKTSSKFSSIPDVNEFDESLEMNEVSTSSDISYDEYQIKAEGRDDIIDPAKWELMTQEEKESAIFNLENC